MSFSRIKAVYIDSSAQTNDMLVFDALLKQDNFIAKMEIFGYMANDNGKWPFYMKYEENKGNMYWGTDTDSSIPEISTINVNTFNKQIRIGEYITYSEICDNRQIEYTYQIHEIRNWNDYCQN
ncbi:MAG: hypothetical protein KA732_18430 [Providencia sp.]|uniref:hypothetical protein n=1 Tax=Providencia sp. TaxID=589 RepID=UPI001B58E326|nr:hypothetical protein [Providencia sp.]MBP6083237.1 hypothetical protein [Providencia sp.]